MKFLIIFILWFWWLWFVWCMIYQKQPPRQFSKISVLFFQEQPFYNFPGGSICSSNRHKFSKRFHLFVEQTWIFQEGLYVLRTDTNFPGGLIEKTCFFKEVLSGSSNRPYHLIEQINFPRNPYLVLEHIRIFQEPLFSHRTDTHFQEALSSPRTHTIFQETPMPRTHRHFPGRHPLSNRYFFNRSRWLLSIYSKTTKILW